MAKKSWMQLLALGLAVLLMGMATPLRAFGQMPATGVSDTELAGGAGVSGLEMAMMALQPCSVEANIVLDKNLVAKGDPMVTVKLEQLNIFGDVVWTDYQTIRFAGGSGEESPRWNNLQPGWYRLSLLPVLRYQLTGIDSIEAGTKVDNTVRFTLSILHNLWKFEGRAWFRLKLVQEDWMSDTDRITNLVLPEPQGGGCG